MSCARGDGYCWLDFVQHFMMDAIHRRDADRAAEEARELAHWLRALRFNDLVEPQEIADKVALVASPPPPAREKE